MEEQIGEVAQDKNGMKNTLIIALVVLIAFFLVSKILSNISTNPAQQSYEKHCASCHGADGKGFQNLIPPLANSDWLANNQDILVCVLRDGISDKIEVNGVVYDQPMDGIKLTDIQLYNIINYINSSWGNDVELTTMPKVQEEYKKCENI